MTTPNQLPQEQIVVNAVANQMVQVSSVHVNVAQQLIVTTEDKLLLCLNERIQHVERQNEWQTPTGILLTLILTFVTTTFQDFIFPKQTWQAVFIVVAIIASIWLIRCLQRLPKHQTVAEVINQIKQGTVVSQSGTHEPTAAGA